MNQTQINPEQQAYFTRRDEIHARRAERRAAGSGVIGALVLITLGCLFLLYNLGFIEISGNYWALFILIPAFGSFATALAVYTQSGTLNAAVRGSLIGGTMLTFLAAVLFFGLSFGLFWPVMIILAGIGALLNGILPH